mgnify:CR=1 FL=1
MKIYVYYNKKIDVFYLPEIVSGSYSFDSDVDEVSKLINIDAKNGQWVLFETDDCKINNGSTYVHELALELNHFYIITRNHNNYLIYVADSDEKDIRAYNFQNDLMFTIGTENRSVTYNCQYSNDLAMKICIQDNKIVLQLIQGKAYINKLKLEAKNYVIKNGDEVELFGAKILFINNIILTIASDSILTVNQQAARLTTAKIHNNDEIAQVDIKDKNLYDEDDYFSKAPRIRRVIETKEIELSEPPAQEKGGEMPFILTVGPMATMALSSLVMLSSSLSQVFAGTSDLKDNISQIMMSVVMMTSSILWPLLTKKYNEKVQKKNIELTKEKYNKYLQDKEKELEAESKLQREILKENVIPIEECFENLKHHNLNFWDKRMDQSDFLVARVGVGNEKLKVTMQYPEKGFTVDEDELKEKVDEMIERYKYIENVPIGYSFYESNVTAVMGDIDKSHLFMDNILFQLLTFYSYDELKIVVFTNEKRKKHWDYIKYLNHNMTNDGALRFFASTEESAETVASALQQEINSRIELITDDDEAMPLFKPYYFVIVDDIDMVKKPNIIDQLTELRKNIGFSLVLIERKLSKLPSLCNNFITLGEKNSGILKNSYEKQEQILFQNEFNDSINMMEVAKVLANIPIEISSGENDASELPESITFLEMEKVGKVEQLNILNRWNTNDSTSNLKAEVGVAPDGKLMYLDLHEKAHGPHGLIAGMTGSGKSEFIITWILSLAVNFSPEDVAFILIDYKGGGLAFAFENQSTGVRLPHLTGTITNLDKAEIDRTLVSIDSEVKRRQKIFNEARDRLGESTIDIYKYQGFYHDGKLEEPLPHLFIVCDEFAELKAQQPEFMDNLISVARIGRSLGVHLILATQKPSGVVNEQIWSNTKFRVCLKVQDASDSNEMLKKPDAASLKQTGRFYLQVGYDEYFALGQSGWCGAKYYPSDVIQKSVDKSVNIIDETGLVIKSIQAGTNTAKKTEAEGEQLAAIMKEIINVSTQNNKFAKKLWLDNIPDIITVEETEQKYGYQYEKNEFNILVGEYDAPESQEQYPLIYNILKDGNTNIYGNDSQESEELLTTILYNIMRNYQSNEVSYYVVDYGSQNFQKFKKAPHCGGVISPGDAEAFTNLMKLIKEEQRTRKKILSDSGLEYTDYIKENPGKLPIMLIILNNYESILESNQVLYEIFGDILRDSERYGIVYIITSSAVSSIQERFKQLMSFALALKLKEAIDYGYAHGLTERKEPKNIFGRGICKNDGVLHEFQTAFICKDRTKENQVLLTLFEELSSKNMEQAKKIPTLPDQVTLQEVSSKLTGIKKIPVGIEKGSLNIKTFDLTVEIGKLVLSSKLKYLTSFMKSFIDEILAIKETLIVLDPTEVMPEVKQKVPNYFFDELDDKLDKIMEFMDKQKENSTKNTIIIINSITKLISKLENSTKVKDLFKKCKESGNCYIVIADESPKIKDQIYEEWFKSIDTSEGVFIGPGVEEQNTLRITTYGKDLGKPMPKNYGYYIAEGMYHIIKVIEFERKEESEDDEE